MATAVTICDETVPRGAVRRFRLELASERLSARELIRRRVTQEVDDYNRSQPELYSGLVEPLRAERVPNGYRLLERRRLDAEEQCAKALEAFGRNGFLLLVGERQVAGLDEEIVLTKDIEVRFLKLVPLIGG